MPIGTAIVTAADIMLIALTLLECPLELSTASAMKYNVTIGQITQKISMFAAL